ncbi:MAG: hypothetical protein HYS87_02365 [Candidatus Colwellbacteria bacterium]|nr:hypothetical protein [Candidatus Colwellbacteria bacterium]
MKNKGRIIGSSPAADFKNSTAWANITWHMLDDKPFGKPFVASFGWRNAMAYIYSKTACDALVSQWWKKKRDPTSHERRNIIRRERRDGWRTVMVKLVPLQKGEGRRSETDFLGETGIAWVNINTPSPIWPNEKPGVCDGFITGGPAAFGTRNGAIDSAIHWRWYKKRKPTAADRRKILAGLRREGYRTIMVKLVLVKPLEP